MMATEEGARVGSEAGKGASAAGEMDLQRHAAGDAGGEPGGETDQPLQGTTGTSGETACHQAEEAEEQAAEGEHCAQGDVLSPPAGELLPPASLVGVPVAGTGDFVEGADPLPTLLPPAEAESSAAPDTAQHDADAGGSAAPGSTAAEAPMPPGSVAFSCWDPDLPGDYRWHDASNEVECVLRLCSNGQWWHAAHRSSTERGRVLAPGVERPGGPAPPRDVRIHKVYKEQKTRADAMDLSRLKGDYVEFLVWELAESMGSWREVAATVFVPAGVADADGGSPAAGSSDEAPVEARQVAAVLLTVEHCNWKANFPNATLSLCPAGEMRAEVDALVAAGQVAFCYAFGRDIVAPAPPAAAPPASERPMEGPEGSGADSGAGGSPVPVTSEKPEEPMSSVPLKGLELHMDLSTVSEWTGEEVMTGSRRTRLRSTQTAFQSLGFSRFYMAGSSNTNSASVQDGGTGGDDARPAAGDGEGCLAL